MKMKKLKWSMMASIAQRSAAYLIPGMAKNRFRFTFYGL